MHFFDPHHSQHLPPSAPASRSGGGNGAASAAIPHTMHDDGAAWQDSLERWKSDTTRWQADHDALLRRLADMQRAVVEHGESLAAHEALFPGISRSLAEFRALVEMPTPPDGAEPLARRHGELIAQVRCCEDAHRRMARHHADVMSRMADLERAACSPL